MSTYKIAGIVRFSSPIETFGNGRESKRIIVETKETYPNYFPISFYGDKIKAIENIKAGDIVEVDTYPGGRLKKGDDTQAFAYFNGAACMVIGADTSTAKPFNTAPKQAQQPVQASAFAGGDDVPF